MDGLFDIRCVGNEFKFYASFVIGGGALLSPVPLFSEMATYFADELLFIIEGCLPLFVVLLGLFS